MAQSPILTTDKSKPGLYLNPTKKLCATFHLTFHICATFHLIPEPNKKATKKLCATICATFVTFKSKALCHISSYIPHTKNIRS